MGNASFARNARQSAFGPYGKNANQVAATAPLATAVATDATDPNWWRGALGEQRIAEASPLLPMAVLLAMCEGRDVHADEVGRLRECGWIALNTTGPQKLFRVAGFEFLEPERNGDTHVYQVLRYRRPRRRKIALAARVGDFGIARQMHRNDRYEVSVLRAPRSYVSP